MGEYWKADANRCVLVDPQFDDIWRVPLYIDHDILDVPRDRFWVAADAWQRCRSGQADPDKFGISLVDLHGLWFIAGNLIRDLAALNKVEMLPWDAWGAHPKLHETLAQGQLAYFDSLAEFTREPDAHFDEILSLYAEDARLNVPPLVFNLLLNQEEQWRRY
jgi:hypothetical protein